MTEKQHVKETWITCPLCWTPVACDDIEKTDCVLGLLTFGFECVTCGSVFLVAYEQIGDKMAWRSRVLM